MQVEKIRKQDLPILKDMMRYCFFRDKKQNMELFFKTRPVFDYGIGIYDHNQLKSALLLIPYDIQWNNRKIPMMGIGGVATMPENRHQGYINKLIKEAIKLIHKNNIPFSMLMPFKPSFYHKYGWGRCFEHHELTVHLDALKGFGNKSLTFRKIDENNIPEMNEVYQEYIKEFNGAIWRKEANWKYNMKWWKRDWEMIELYGAFDSSGKMQAYINYQIENQDQKLLRVNEWGFRSPIAKHELYRFVYYHSAQADKALLKFRQGDPVLSQFLDIQGKYNILPFMMNRAIDVNQVLEMLQPDSPLQANFKLKINDPIADWNHGTWNIEIRNESVTAELSPSANPDAECSINTFSMISMGYIGFQQAIVIGELKVYNNNSIPALESLFPQKKTLLMDFF